MKSSVIKRKVKTLSQLHKSNHLFLKKTQIKNNSFQQHFHKMKSSKELLDQAIQLLKLWTILQLLLLKNFSLFNFNIQHRKGKKELHIRKLAQNFQENIFLVRQVQKMEENTFILNKSLWQQNLNKFITVLLIKMTDIKQQKFHQFQQAKTQH